LPSVVSCKCYIDSAASVLSSFDVDSSVIDCISEVDIGKGWQQL
jgi:hypothetical protein